MLISARNRALAALRSPAFSESLSVSSRRCSRSNAVVSGAASGGIAVSDSPESTRPTIFSTSADSAGFVRTSDTPLDSASALASRSP